MTHLSRRHFIAGAAALGTGALGVGSAGAQVAGYPSQDIRFISGNAAGSGGDIIVRFFAEKLRPLMGRTVLVENKVGALGNIATEFVARSKPDGHTIQITSGSSLAANMHMFKVPPVDPGKALQVISPISRSTMMIAVHTSSPHKDLKSLVAAMKAKGNKGSYAHATAIAKVIGAMFTDKAGLETVDVPYKTGDLFMNDLASGNVDFAIPDHVQASAQERAGRLRLLAVASSERLKVMPHLPTMTEAAGLPIDIKTWWGVTVPAGTPQPIIQQLNAWVRQVVNSDDAKTFLNNIGTDPWATSTDEAQAWMREQIVAWKDYVVAAKIEPQG